MPDVNWDQIIADAKADTDAKFASKISSLTTLTDKDIEDLLKAGLTKEDLAAVSKEILDATKDNNAKANAIKTISKGVETLVFIASKLL